MGKWGISALAVKPIMPMSNAVNADDAVHDDEPLMRLP